MSKTTKEQLVEIIRSQTHPEWGEYYHYEELADEILSQGFIHKSQVDKSMEELIQYCAHERDCLLSQCRAGEPTDEAGYDGYKSLFGYGDKGKWYGRNELPECSCGLNDLIKKFEAIASGDVLMESDQ